MFFNQFTSSGIPAGQDGEKTFEFIAFRQQFLLTRLLENNDIGRGGRHVRHILWRRRKARVVSLPRMTGGSPKNYSVQKDLVLEL